MNIEAVYAVFPPAVFDGREATPYVFVTSSPAAGDTQVLPCTPEGYVLNLLLLGHVVALDHAAALRAAGYELEAERERLRTQLSAKLSTLRASSTRKGLEYKNPVRHGYDLALVDALALLGVDATERDRSAEPAPAVDSETELGLLLAQKREGGDR